MAGLTTENLNYKIPLNIRDVKAGTLGPNLSVAQILGQTVQSFYKVVDAVAGTDYTWGLFTAKFDMTLIAAEFIPHAALTADDTDYATLTVQTVEGTPDVKATMSDTTTGGTGDWVLNTAETFTVGDTVIDAGDVLALKIAKSGSGVAVPAGTLNLWTVLR